MFPRVTGAHTSREAEGQICVPEMNWALCILCVALVIAFKESARLAAAYGVAVSGNRPLRGLCASQLTLPLHRGAPETGQARSPRSAGRASFMWRKWLQAAFRDARRG